LRRALVEQGLLAHWNPRGLVLPVREMLGFSLPVVVSDVLVAMRPTLAIVLLEYFRGTLGVADFRASLPISGLNMIVMQSMKLLYLPVASRMYARGDHAGIGDLFAQTAIWIAVITFPIFAVCVVVPESTVVLINGEDYAGAGNVLVALAVGEYLSAALGLNAYTLQVYARVRYLLVTTVIATAIGLVLNLALIPALGALGAALATTGALIVQNFLQHAGLQRGTPVDVLGRRTWSVYASIAAAIALLLAAHFLRPPLALEVAFIAAVALFLLRFHRETMDLHGVFPELARLPLLGRFLAARKSG
jgi:O-antigen/teichoic acid export membrane protein